LGYEVFEVSESLEPVEDYLVIDPDVVMDEDVAEADRLADGAGEFGSADSVLAEQLDGVAVVRRRCRLVSPAADSRFSTEVSSVMPRSRRRTRSSSTMCYLRLAVTAAANSR
jgi:hypothetical protein